MTDFFHSILMVPSVYFGYCSDWSTSEVTLGINKHLFHCGWLLSSIQIRTGNLESTCSCVPSSLMVHISDCSRMQHLLVPPNTVCCHCHCAETDIDFCYTIWKQFLGGGSKSPLMVCVLCGQRDIRWNIQWIAG